MRRWMYGVVMILSVVAAGAAFGESYYCDDGTITCVEMPPGYEGGDNTGGGGSKWLGGDYIQCTAKGSRGQGCWEVQTTYDPRTRSLVQSCGFVSHNAACACNYETFDTKGICSYYP